MIFECPNCTQSLEVENAGAGQTIHCPTCGEPVIIPDPSSSGQEAQPERIGPRPPMHVPLQPLGAGATKPLIKKRRGYGCGSTLFLLLVLAGIGFAYLMYRVQEPPQQTADRVRPFV